MTELKEDHKGHLINKLRDAKANEDYYRKLRIEAEQQLQEVFVGVEGGNKSYEYDGFKLTIKRPMNIKFDLDAYSEIEADLPESCRPVKIKTELDKKKLSEIQSVNPEAYLNIAECLTKTPGKVSAVIEPLS